MNGGIMNGSLPASPSTASMGAMAAKKKHYMHMTLFWGKNSEILFNGWPGSRGGHYALALIVLFLMGFLAEWLSSCRFTRPGWAPRLKLLARVIVHATNMTLGYLVMLALMSFNVGVLLVAIAGHGVGYLLFGSSFFHQNQNECAACGATAGGGDHSYHRC